MISEDMKMSLEILNTVGGCTAGIRWASLTMDYVGEPIPKKTALLLWKELTDSHFGVCSCPNHIKPHCSFGHLPNDERRNPTKEVEA